MNIKKTIAFFLLFMLLSKVTAQDDYSSILYLKNGNSLKGKISIINLSKVHYKKNKKSKTRYFKAHEVDSITKYKNGQAITKIYKKKKGKKKYHFMRRLIKGKVNLYLYEEYMNASNPATANNNLAPGGNKGGVKYYYVERQNENEVTFVGTTHFLSKKFNKNFFKFFSDCPLLLKKVKNKEYKVTQMSKIVDYYNSNCIKK